MPELEFTLTGPYVELHHLLKLTGIRDSGGAAKALVASGAVSVEGQRETRKTRKIRPGQAVSVRDLLIIVRIV